MRVLAIHRYYWPDTPPYASLLRTILARWSADGHDTEVLTSQPSYKPELGLAARPPREQVDATTVRRLSFAPDRSSARRRLLNMVWFPLRVAWHVLRGPRFDVVMCSTVPPVLLGSAVSLAARRRGARFVYHCMDLHPEIGVLSGDFANPVVRRVLARLDLATCRRSAKIVVLSEDMRRSLLARDPALDERIVVLTNFEVSDHGSTGSGPAEAAVSPLPADDTRLRIAFTGNLGRFQGLETVVQALLGDDDRLDELELVLMGEGAVKADLERLVTAAPPERRARVRMLPHGSVSQARALLRTADLGLVSLTPGVISYAYPSKTATYLAEGLPLLVMVEADSELARQVETRAGRPRPPARAGRRAGGAGRTQPRP